MSGLRYRNIGPFVAGRKMRLKGVDYMPDDPIDPDVVAELRHLDALLSNKYIKTRQGPFTASGAQVRHVPRGVRRELKLARKTPEQVMAWIGTDKKRAEDAYNAELENDPQRAEVLRRIAAILNA